jgi:hypothetical protein
VQTTRTATSTARTAGIARSEPRPSGLGKIGNSGKIGEQSI